MNYHETSNLGYESVINKKQSNSQSLWKGWQHDLICVFVGINTTFDLLWQKNTQYLGKRWEPQ